MRVLSWCTYTSPSCWPSEAKSKRPLLISGEPSSSIATWRSPTFAWQSSCAGREKPPRRRDTKNKGSRPTTGSPRRNSTAAFQLARQGKFNEAISQFQIVVALCARLRRRLSKPGRGPDPTRPLGRSQSRLSPGLTGRSELPAGQAKARAIARSVKRPSNLPRSRANDACPGTPGSLKLAKLRTTRSNRHESYLPDHRRRRQSGLPIELAAGRAASNGCCWSTWPPAPSPPPPPRRRTSRPTCSTSLPCGHCLSAIAPTR